MFRRAILRILRQASTYWLETLRIVIFAALLLQELSSANLSGLPTSLTTVSIPMTLRRKATGKLAICSVVNVVFRAGRCSHYGRQSGVTYFTVRAFRNCLRCVAGDAILYCFDFFQFLIIRPGRWTLSGEKKAQ
jgi:hypothetical protein